MKCRLAIGLDYYDLAGASGVTSDTQGLQVTYSVNSEQVAYLGVDEARQLFRPGSNVTASFSSAVEFPTVAACEAEIGFLYEFLKDQDGTVTAYLGNIADDGTNQIETATAAGTGRTQVTLNAVAGSTIYYTTDGSDPTTGSTSAAPGSVIFFTGSGVVKAMATRSGVLASPITSRPVIIAGTVAAATVSPDSSLENLATEVVTVTEVTPGSTLHYTTNGTTPTTGSPTVASGGTVSVPVPGTIKVLAVKAGLSNSPIKEASYAPAEVPASTTVGEMTSGTYVGGSTTYRWFEFNGNGSFTVPANTVIDYLVAGGGGAGGGRDTVSGGGGGAGRVVTGSGVTLPAGTHAITIGQGGISSATGPATSAADGGTTIFGSIATAAGGGGGGVGANQNGRAGASGGGATAIGVGGTASAGNIGGAGLATGRAGGGGGATAVGSTQSSATADLAPADGVTSSLRGGVSTQYGRGGGVYNSSSFTINRGSGGHGRHTTAGGLGHNGGLGTVIIRYALTGQTENPPTLATQSNGISTGFAFVTVTQTTGSTAVAVPIAAGETAATWAATARAQLAAEPAIARNFIISGAGTSIVLTSRRHQSDSALNVAITNALASGPSAGITEAPTSADTAPGSPDTVTPIMTIYGAIAQVSATYRGKTMTINSSITGRTTP